MITSDQVGLAVAADAPRIAELSRMAIEHGLPWRWTPPRVLACIRNRYTNVIVAREGDAIVGFAIMKYLEHEAHVLLLAVRPAGE